MPIADLAPEIAVLLTAVAILLVAMVLPQRLHGWCAVVAIAGLAVAAVFAAAQFDAMRLTFSGTFALDRATAWGRLLIVGFTAFAAALGPSWLATDRRHGEFYAVLLFSALGAMAMAGASDLMQLVMGVLLASVSGYILAAYHRDWPISLEAGMKYFLIGALSNALLVIGVVFLVGTAVGTDYRILSTGIPSQPLAGAGVALVLLGLFFKLGAVPAHTWMPDVAEGAPVPSAAFLTVVPKVGAVIALLRFVSVVPEEVFPVRTLVAITAAVTMTVGNLTALWQTDVRRLLGWSSVSQSGYALMAVAVAGQAGDAEAALIAFVAVYGVATMTAFAVVAHLRGRTEIAHYAGLLRVQPFATAVLALALLSLVGIPPLAGFLGKFALFTATIGGGLAWLAIIAVANTVISLFYYLRVIAPAVLARPEGDVATFGKGSLAVVAFSVLALLAITPFWDPLWNPLWSGLVIRLLP